MPDTGRFLSVKHLLPDTDTLPIWCDVLTVWLQCDRVRMRQRKGKVPSMGTLYHSTATTPTLHSRAKAFVNLGQDSQDFQDDLQP